MLSGGRYSVDLCGRQHSCADLLPLCSTGRVSSLLAYVSTFADEETSSLLVCLHLNHTPCQGGRIEQVWTYALHYVTTFDKWLWEVYFPQHFPDYERYRARYIGLPAPKTRKHLPSPMNRAQAVHARFGWE